MEIKLNIENGVALSPAVLAGEIKNGDMFLYKGDCYLKVDRSFELAKEESFYVNLVKNRIDRISWREWVVPVKGYVEVK